MFDNGGGIGTIESCKPDYEAQLETNRKDTERTKIELAQFESFYHYDVTRSNMYEFYGAICARLRELYNTKERILKQIDKEAQDA